MVPMGSHRYSNIMYLDTNLCKPDDGQTRPIPWFPWDPIGTATLCTLIDTNLCKPDDGQTRPIPWFPWDPIGTATLCTLIDTNLCKPDYGKTRPKHVADVTSCRITTVSCVVKRRFNSIKFVREMLFFRPSRPNSKPHHPLLQWISEILCADKATGTWIWLITTSSAAILLYVPSPMCLNDLTKPRRISNFLHFLLRSPFFWYISSLHWMRDALPFFLRHWNLADWTISLSLNTWNRSLYIVITSILIHLGFLLLSGRNKLHIAFETECRTC